MIPAIPSLEEIREKAMKETPEDVATFDGQTLRFTAHYTYPEPHAKEYEFNVCDPEQAQYWVAVGGKCFGVTSPQYGETCIATVMHAFHAQNELPVNKSWLDGVYVIWKPKNHAPAVWKRWNDKWSKRTA